MINVVSFSGGRTSAYMVHELIKQGIENLHFVYMDTGAEDEKTYEFIRNIVKHWGIDLKCIRVVYNPELGQGNGYEVLNANQIGKDLAPWKGMLKKYGLPMINMPYCTGRMKTEPCKKYLDDTFGVGNYNIWLGMRADEPKRLPEEVLIKLNLPIKGKPKKQTKNYKYLAEISDFDKQDIINWWKSQQFDLGIEEHIGNCIFCIKKGVNKVALAAKDRPEEAIEWAEMIESDNVRFEGRKVQHKGMYRNRISFVELIGMYEKVDRDDLFKTLRSSKSFDTGSCSEHCEAFGE